MQSADLPGFVQSDQQLSTHGLLVVSASSGTRTTRGRALFTLRSPGSPFGKGRGGGKRGGRQAIDLLPLSRGEFLSTAKDLSPMRHIRIDLAEANAFVAAHHRHHSAVIGHVFSLGAESDGRIVGVVIVGRPVSRFRDDGQTAEVTRLCTDGTRNACSFLYGAAARAAFALGFTRIGTYILASEPGTSLTAAGWRLIGETPGGSWSRSSRPRVDKHPLQGRLLFERSSLEGGDVR